MNNTAELNSSENNTSDNTFELCAACKEVPATHGCLCWECRLWDTVQDLQRQMHPQGIHPTHAGPQTGWDSRYWMETEGHHEMQDRLPRWAD